jgi:hypothetical protein
MVGFPLLVEFNRVECTLSFAHQARVSLRTNQNNLTSRSTGQIQISTEIRRKLPRIFAQITDRFYYSIEGD